MGLIPKIYEVVVIGSGLNGLATLYHLHRLGLRNLALIERFELEHDRGSSHGHARITRSTYDSANYVRLMQVVRAEEWPRLERDAGLQLVHPNPVCVYGPPGKTIEKYAEAVKEIGAEVDWLESAEARRRFPQFRFPGAEGVLLDHTAGVIAAAKTISALARLCRERGVDVFEREPAKILDPSSDPIELETGRGVIKSERVVVTAGAWAPEIFPFLRDRLKVARQTVGYFRPEGPPEDYRIGRFPSWIYLVPESENIHFYGMPEFGREGIKVARHGMSESEDDPNESPAEADPAKVEELFAFLAAHFTAAGQRLAGTEHCLYTNTASEDFILDLHPQNPRIAIGAGFSGHGFKFGPLTGRILAELVTAGKTSVPEFEGMRTAFSISNE